MKKKRGRKTKRPSRAEFEFKYYACDINAEELAKEYGVTTHTIYNWAVEFNKKPEMA